MSRRNTVQKLTILFILALFGVSPAAAQGVTLGKEDLKKLVALMSGEFSSEEQSKADRSFFHITLRMKPIWTKRKDGFWLYVEQAAADAQDKPYRQRIYNVFKKDKNTIVSKVFEMPQPESYVGAWRDTGKFGPLTAESLIDRAGCSVVLRKNSDGTFAGSTSGKECLSSLRGAAYATSEVTIYADKLVSWDRGWDKTDKQVWGSTAGGYIFKRLKDLK